MQNETNIIIKTDDEGEEYISLFEFQTTLSSYVDFDLDCSNAKPKANIITCTKADTKLAFIKSWSGQDILSIPSIGKIR